MKAIIGIGAASFLAIAWLAIAQASSEQAPTNVHGWQPPTDDSHQSWWAPRPGDPETGRMSDHGWVAPVNKDCSLNHVDIEGSAQLRCMK
jgi:hypothetical protein